MIVNGIDYVENSYELSVNLRILRERAEITQTYVSKIINVERSNIAYYENGKTVPSIFTLIYLAKVYGVEPLTLIKRNFTVLY